MFESIAQQSIFTRVGLVIIQLSLSYIAILVSDCFLCVFVCARLITHAPFMHQAISSMCALSLKEHTVCILQETKAVEGLLQIGL